MCTVVLKSGGDNFILDDRLSHTQNRKLKHQFCRDF